MKAVMSDSNAEGWVRSDVANVELRSPGGDKLEIRIAGQDATLAKLP